MTLVLEPPTIDIPSPALEYDRSFPSTSEYEPLTSADSLIVKTPELTLVPMLFVKIVLSDEILNPEWDEPVLSLP
jgi:hypothetical protein